MDQGQQASQNVDVRQLLVAFPPEDLLTMGAEPAQDPQALGRGGRGEENERSGPRERGEMVVGVRYRVAVRTREG